jgi:methionyl-tRNA formyltransferase
MRLIFAGTPEFAAVALRALIAAGHEVSLVLTQPDRRAGRGLKSAPSEVKKIALDQMLNIFQPVSLKDAEACAHIISEKADAMVVAAYGLILPPAILSLPRLGCINIHASLLPRWRGAAPIQRAILAGDRETGVTIMQMDEGLDTGDMLLQRAIPIGADETAGELHDRLARLGGELIVEALQTLPAPVPQDPALATYAAKLTREEALIDWGEPAEVIARKVRAYNPYLGAAASYLGEPLKIWRAHAVAAGGEAGRVLSSAEGKLIIACGDGALQVEELQRAGGRRLGVAAFLAGHAIAPGARLSG